MAKARFTRYGASVLSTALVTSSALAQPALVNTTGTGTVLRSRESSANNSAVVNVISAGDSAPGSGVAQARGVVLINPTTGAAYTAGGGSGGSNAAAGTNGTTAPTSSSSTGFTNASGNETAVSATNPFPVTVVSGGGSGGGLGTTTTPNIVGGGANTPFTQGIGSADANTLRAYLASGNVVAQGSASTALTQGTAAAGASSLNVYVGGSVTQTTQGVGAEAATAAGNPNRVSGVDQNGASRTIATMTNGVLDTPRSSVASRVVTRTAVTANTSTTVCPAAATIVAETVFIPSSGTGVGWSGQALTSAAPGTATTTPEFATVAANFTWTPVVAPTNAITAYGPAQTIVCVQDVKQ